MKKLKKQWLTALFAVMLLQTFTAAQTGDGFDLSHNVIASGGGSNSTGSSGGQTFTVDGTVGQNLAGTVSTGPNGQGGQFLVRGGFWAFQPVAPTAAMVSVGGRVSTEPGLAISNARVYLTDSSGTIRAAVTNSFGYYRIDGVEVGQTYILTALSKGFQFTPLTIAVTDELLDLDIIALP